MKRCERRLCDVGSEEKSNLFDDFLDEIQSLGHFPSHCMPGENSFYQKLKFLIALNM